MTKKLVVILLAGVVYMAGVSAENERRLGRPEAIGTMNSIDFLAHTITLDGETYAITDKTTWVGLKAGESPRNAATKLVDHRLGFELQDVGEGSPVVTQIWVMP